MTLTHSDAIWAHSPTLNKADVKNIKNKKIKKKKQDKVKVRDELNDSQAKVKD
ncbi:MAG: hypothetical protein QXE64_01650 [Candidatus Pacearchaeota archaeon]